MSVLPEAEVVDLATWDRAAVFRMFRQARQPHMSVTQRVDATRAMTVLRPAGVSPFLAMGYAIVTACNRVAAFRLRLCGETVLRYRTVSISGTVPIDGGRFSFFDVAYDPDWARYRPAAEAAIAAAKAHADLTDLTDGRDDVIYTTCLPWLDFTSYTNALPGPDDTIPRIAWGKMVEDGGGWHVPVSVEVNHMMVDGRDLGAFYTAVDDTLAAIPVG